MLIAAAYAVHSCMISHTIGAFSMGHRVFHKRESMKELNIKNLHRGRDSWYEWMSALKFMANDFLAWWGIWNIEQYSVPRQPNCNNDGEQWKELLYWELNTYKHQVIFFKNRVDKEEVKTKYFLTQMMLADYFIKPL